MFRQDSDHLDQHFLVDKEVIKDFVSFANINKEDVVVEVGPGEGTLTKEISKKAKRVICIELDSTLKDKLELLTTEYENVEIIYDNVLKTYIPPCTKIVSALPYSIIEPFINKLLKCDFEEVVLLMGNRYVDSVITGKITKLSLLTNCFFKSEKGREVLPESFNPKPHCLSSFIKLTPISKEYYKEESTLFFFREMFFRRLLKIKKSLMEGLIDFYKMHNRTLTKKEAKKKIEQLGLKEDLLNKNMESLSNEELQKFYDFLVNKKDILWKD